MGGIPRGRERWINWFVGLVFGVAVAIAAISGGIPGLLLGLVGSMAGFVLLRSVVFLGGVAVAVGVTWLALLVRAEILCDAANQTLSGACRGQGVAPFLILCLVLLALGVLMTIGARAGADSEEKSEPRQP